jgi:hypothetical protein
MPVCERESQKLSLGPLAKKDGAIRIKVRHRFALASSSFLLSRFATDGQPFVALGGVENVPLTAVPQAGMFPRQHTAEI